MVPKKKKRNREEEEEKEKTASVDVRDMRVRFSLASVLAWRPRPRCRSQPPLVSGARRPGGGTHTRWWWWPPLDSDSDLALSLDATRHDGGDAEAFFFFFSLFHRPTSPHEVVGLGRGLSKHLVVLLWGRFCLYFFFFYSDPTTATRWRNSAGSGLDVCSPEFIRAAAVGG